MRYAVRTALLALALTAALQPTLAADIDPPEVKDGAPEARGNVQEKDKGVIQPPAGVDPNMKTNPPAADQSRTPVIPPPREKDGRRIEPK